MMVMTVEMIIMILMIAILMIMMKKMTTKHTNYMIFEQILSIPRGCDIVKKGQKIRAWVNPPPL